jgi:putative tricarboxylic transport membrane protein
VRIADLFVALLLLAFGVAVVIQAESVGVGWIRGRPQSGFLPFWLGVALILLCLLVLAQILWRWRRTTEPFFSKPEDMWSVLKVAGTALLALPLIYYAGFYAAAAIYLLIYTRWVGKHRWYSAVLLSIGIPIGTYVVFERWLLILLPRGLYDLFGAIVSWL